MKSEEGDVVERRRIAACCWGEGRPATCLVMLDDQGSLVDILYLPSFSGQQRMIRANLDYSIAEDAKKVGHSKSLWTISIHGELSMLSMETKRAWAGRVSTSSDKPVNHCGVLKLRQSLKNFCRDRSGPV